VKCVTLCISDSLQKQKIITQKCGNEEHTNQVKHQTQTHESPHTKKHWGNRTLETHD